MTGRVLTLLSFNCYSPSQPLLAPSLSSPFPSSHTTPTTAYQHLTLALTPTNQPTLTTTTTHNHTTTNTKMSALARPTTILAGLAVAGAATTFTARNKATDFAPASMASAEIDAAGKPVVPKAKL